jgi:DNA-binding GntR family transcriptional regulator
MSAVQYCAVMGPPDSRAESMARTRGPVAASLAGTALIRADSVVDLAYRRIRSLVLDGEILPGARLGQVELAQRLGISRTPVREALRRLAGEGLAEFVPNRGFRAAELGLDGVRRRLEVRLLLEPGAARLAAQRRTDEDLAAMAEAAELEERAPTRLAAHDASRAFHLAMVRATRNAELVAIFESLWVVEIGRRLLASRAAEGNWTGADASEHRAIAEAVGDRDGDLASRLMSSHVSDALRHWHDHELPQHQHRDAT